MSLLPWSSADIDSSQDEEIVVLDVDDEAADQIFSVLSSSTARTLLSTIQDDPGSPSELADRADTTVQNTMYHLDRLEDAGLIRVAGTQYSEKGKEMKVYAPAKNPMVMFVGTEERKTDLLTRLERIIGAIGVTSFTSLFVYILLTRELPFVDTLGSTGGQSSPSIVISAFIGSLLTFLGVLGWRRLHNRSPRYLNDSRLPSWVKVGTSTSSLSNRATAVAAVLFVLSAGFWFLRGLEAAWVGTPGFFDVLLFSSIVASVLAAGIAYHSHQLLISWLYPFAVFTGLPFYMLSAVLTGAPLLSSVVLGMMYLIGATLGSAVIGTVGYVIGRGIRISVESFSTYSSDTS